MYIPPVCRTRGLFSFLEAGRRGDSERPDRKWRCLTPCRGVEMLALFQFSTVLVVVTPREHLQQHRHRSLNPGSPEPLCSGGLMTTANDHQTQIARQHPTCGIVWWSMTFACDHLC